VTAGGNVPVDRTLELIVGQGRYRKLLADALSIDATFVDEKR